MKRRGIRVLVGETKKEGITDSESESEREVREMAGTIIDLTTVVDLTDQVHHLPCCIKYNGPSSVSDYFKPKPTGVEVEGLKVEQSYFRGRKLQGAIIPLPEGYTGFVLGKKNPDKKKGTDISGDNLNSWETNAKFQNITYWNHDDLPSRDDACLRSFHLFTIAEALHKPVTVEDLASQAITQEPK